MLPADAIAARVNPSPLNTTFQKLPVTGPLGPSLLQDNPELVETRTLFVPKSLTANIFPSALVVTP